MLWGLARVLLFLFTLSVFVPWTLSLAPDELDSSWTLVMEWAHFQHAQFGTDLVFTFGPWSFAIVGHFPGIFPWVVVVWTLFGVAFFAAVSRIADYAIRKPWPAFAWLFLVIWFAGGAYTQMQDVRLFAICWLPLVLYFCVDDSTWEWRKLLLAAAMALACEIKFSVFFVAAPVLWVVSVDQLFRRRLPSLLLIFIAAYLAFWFGAFQHWNNLWPYIHRSWLIASGYAEGEYVSRPSDARDVAIFVVACGALLFGTAMLRPGQSTRLRRYLHAFGLAGVLWTIFKAGYVRHDLHEILATSSFALLTIVYAAPLWKEARHRLTRVGLVLFGGAVFCLAVNSAFPGWNPRVVEFFENTFLDTPQRFEVAIEWICGSPLTEYQRDDLKDPLANPVPHVDGTVDVYSWGQRSVIINGLDYDPRPVFHSYLTYTTALSRLNADFLRSAKAPQNIFFQPQPLDNHYPSQEESLSWPELFTRYAPADATGSRLYLKKSEPARDYSILPIQHLTARLGEWIAVPDATDPIWANLDIHLTPAGRIVRALYKPPTLLLTIKTRSGDVESYRLLTDVAAGGFLLSPRIWDQLSFATVYSTRWKKVLSRSEVIQIMVSFSDNAKSYYCWDEYDLTFCAWRSRI